MQLGKFSEQILRLYYGGDIPDENGIMAEDVNLLIIAAANHFTPINLYENMKDVGRQISTLFLSVYEEVPVLLNKARNRYYVELPVMPVELNHGLAINHVGPMEDEESAWIPVPPNFMRRTKDTVVQYLEDEVGYEQEGKNLYLINYERLQKDVKTVLVKMISDFDDLDEDDELPIPQKYHKSIIDYCLDRLPKRGPDTKNDNKIE